MELCCKTQNKEEEHGGDNIEAQNVSKAFGITQAKQGLFDL